MTTRVRVVGAGIAGMTAAHELAEREGFEVHVYEEKAQVGGKAASQPMLVGGRLADALGEHGFRFFPWFYRHLPDTLRRIPCGNDGDTVLDMLREARLGGVALEGGLHAIPREPGPLDALTLIKVFFGDLRVEMPDLVKYAFHLGRFWTACEDRKLVVYENESWSRYIRADKPGFYTPRFQRLVKDIPLMLVAMRADEGSARTIGHAAIQLMVNIDERTNDLTDAILAAPTSRSWMRPWQQYLEGLGVRFHFGKRLERIRLNAHDDRIVEIGFAEEESIDVSQEHVVCAVPIEGMMPLLKQIAYADASLRELRDLIDDQRPPVGDMIGAQYALPEDIPLLAGHIAFAGTDWALTAVSQPQFWSEARPTLEDYFEVPGLRGVISAIASDWNTPVSDRASPVHGRAARDCTEQEVLHEIWRQMRVTLGEDVLRDSNEPGAWLAAQLDRNVELSPFRNHTPLLVHPPGSYLRRPLAEVEEIANLALASDYVRTRTDIATMESANEAGRRAALAVLRRTGSGDSPRFFEHKLGFDTLRRLDCMRWALSLSHLYDALSLQELELPEPQLLTDLETVTTLGDLPVAGDEFEKVRRVTQNARDALPLRRRIHEEWSEEALTEWQGRLLAGLPPE